VVAAIVITAVAVKKGHDAKAPTEKTPNPIFAEPSEAGSILPISSKVPTYESVPGDSRDEYITVAP
jgi:hypothetical protein